MMHPIKREKSGACLGVEIVQYYYTMRLQIIGNELIKIVGRLIWVMHGF